MPSFEINIKTTDDPRGVQSATEEANKLTDAMGKLLERAQRKEEYKAAKEAIAGMSDEEKAAALAAYEMETAHEKLDAELSNVEKAVAGTRTTISGLDSEIKILGKSVGTSADFLSGLGASIPLSPMMLLGQAVQSAGSILEKSISGYAAYAEQVDEISSYTGMASEETSRLIQVSDDYRIEVSTLEMALKSMAEKGTVPTLAGLASLSDQYLAIRDPLKQAQFLTDNFGRSGVEMARLMELGSKQLLDSADDVSKYMVITGKSRKEAIDFIQTLDDFTDSALALGYAIAEKLLPSITAFIKLLLNRDAASAAAFLNTLFEGTWLESSASKAARASEESNSHPHAINPGDPDYDPHHTNGARASGGPVQAGRLYTINENMPWTGPETFVAPADGIIYPSLGAGQQALGSQATQVINVQFNYQPTVSLADRYEAEQKLVPYIKSALRNL